MSRVPARAGRSDDAARIREINRTFADDNIVAVVALRGGAWLTRLLDRIDFQILERRRRPLTMFGFSELTPLLNIAAQYASVRAYYDLCPLFLFAGLTQQARTHQPAVDTGESPESFARGSAAARFQPEFVEFFRDVTRILDGSGSQRTLTGQSIGTPLKSKQVIHAVGGNLCTLLTALASQHADCLSPNGHWLALEDIRETPDRIDRMLSHFSLSGRLAQYEGFLVGRFLHRTGDHTAAAVACLRRHLGRTRRPIVTLNEFGHLWPMSPLLLRRPITLRVTRSGSATIDALTE